MTLFGIQITSPFNIRKSPKNARRLSPSEKSIQTLVKVPPGSQAVVIGFLAGMPAVRYAHLRAYGLAPGSQVYVVQHAPVTVIRIEHLELALEGGLAQEIQVTFAE